MCGISGEVRFSGAEPERQTVEAMNATMAQRGPDGEGIWTDGQAALGHRRLAVLDPEGGQQPMTHETAMGTVALSYVGEVYNHDELRRELEARGHDFRTRSDTEVILKGYLEYGDRVAEKLRGMFGFAIWDNRRGADRLLLARDPLGVKPLCYYNTPDGVVFGSGPKAILAHPRVKPSVGISGWREHLVAAHSPGRLIWDGMQEVKPGTTVTIDAEGIKEQAYWRLQSHDHSDSPDATVKKVRELLEGIVDEQMVADVPVGVLLSGGLDSSAIAALAARMRGMGRLASYAVDFTGHAEHLSDNVLQTGLDAPFAEEVATMWDMDHTRFVLDSIRLASRELRERVIQARDLTLGTGDTHASRLLLFERIREHSKVALSGEMADELFGGYKIFFDRNVLEGNGWPWDLHNPQAHLARLDRLNPEFRDALDLDTYLADTYADAVRSVERVAGESALDHRLRQINYLEITRHIGFLLDFTDRLSGAAGLEVRVPYCDPRLVEYVYNTPWNIKAPGGRVKGLLKEAAGDLLPSSVLEREKSPYPWTPHPGYLREIQRQARELAAQPSSPVFKIINRTWLTEVTGKPIDQLTFIDRDGINQALELDVWLELRQPVLTGV